MKASTKTPPKTRSKAAGKTSQKQKMSKKQPEELKNSFDTLKGHLVQLEKEQKVIRAELAKKRKARAEKLQKIRETRERSTNSLKRIETGLEASKSEVVRQKKYLKAMRKVQRQNEDSLNQIASRLDGLETVISAGELSVGQLKDELIGMLSDLQTIRQRREKVENLFS